MRVPIQTVSTCDISNLFQVSPVYFVQLQTRSQCFSLSSRREEEGPLQTRLVQFTHYDVKESLFDINNYNTNQIILNEGLGKKGTITPCYGNT